MEAESTSQSARGEIKFGIQVDGTLSPSAALPLPVDLSAQTKAGQFPGLGRFYRDHRPAKSWACGPAGNTLTFGTTARHGHDDLAGGSGGPTPMPFARNLVSVFARLPRRWQFEGRKDLVQCVADLSGPLRFLGEAP